MTSLQYSTLFGDCLEIAHMIDDDGHEYEILWQISEGGVYSLVKPGTFNISQFNRQLEANFQPSTWGNPAEPCYKYDIPMSFELAKINTATAIQQQNENLVAKAKAAVEPAVNKARELHKQLQTADALQLEAQDQELNGLQVKLKDSYTIIEDRRKAITQELDAVKSKMIEPGKDILAIGNDVKAIRDAWAAEKVRRERLAEQEKQKKIARENDLIRIKQEWQNGWNSMFLNKVNASKTGIANKFYSLKTQEEFDAWEKQLRAWNTEKVALDNPPTPVSQHVTSEDIQQIGAEVHTELQPRFNAEFHEVMSAEIEETILKVPGRLAELSAADAATLAAAEERRKKEDKEREDEADRLKKQREDASAAEAASAQLNKTMEIASAAVPTVEKTKGTVVKQKYVPTTHKGWIALIQSWVANDMALMTLEELAKKLSFMKTAAEKRLNDKKNPEEITAEGLEIEEDYSTRGSRSNAA